MCHLSCCDPTGSRLSALNAKPSLLLGIEEQRDALVKMLSESGSHNKKKIVSIVGFGGLGKTTLANAVYEKLKVDGRFRYTAFVPVGRKPDLKKILSDIIIQCLDKKRYSKEFQCLQALDEYQLIDELQEILKDKRYVH
jgi:ABC-type branched-subunit amino acid transport system ATPase component